MCRVIPILNNAVQRGLRGVAAVLLGLAALPALAQANYAFEQQVHAVGQGEYFGDAMALSGDTLAVADRHTSGNDVYVYARSGSQWVMQQAIDVPDWNPTLAGVGAVETRDRLALAGDLLVIGSPGDTVAGNYNVGSIRIYRRVGNTWTFQQRIDRPALAGGADSMVGGFGAAIAIDGDRLVVGAPKSHLYGFGRVFEFARVGNTWTHVATVLPQVGEGNLDRFGQSVALRGDRLIVGSPANDRAFAFRRVGGGWQQEAILTPGIQHASLVFGHAVAVSGDHAFVGAKWGPAPDGRAVHVYYRSNGVWGLVQKLSPASADDFGSSLAVDGDRLAVSDPTVLNVSESRRGRVHVYERNGLFWQERQQLLYPVATGTSLIDFGGRVAISGDVLMAATTGIGAPTATTDSGNVVAFRRPAPALVLSTPVGFGSVAVGGTSAAKNLTVSNAGNAPLTISAVQAATAPFARVAGGTCGNLLPIVVPAGASCTIRYTFAPAATGAANQSLAFTSNDPAGAKSAQLTGTGVAAQLAVTPGDLYVGSTVVGVPTAPATLTIQNVGAVALTVQSIGAPGAPFGAVAGGTCLAPPFTLAAGQSCTRRYVYSPTTAGFASTEFTITSSATNSPHTVSLSGFADGPGLSLDGGSVLDFGSVALDATSMTLTQTLFSAGVTDLVVQSITAPQGPFERAGGNCATPPFTLPPDVSCTLVYRFIPQALGPASATIAVASNAPQPVMAFELKGVGATPALLIGDNPLDLGDARVGQMTATRSATLLNVGNAALSITSIGAASAPFARVGGNCGTPPFALPPGASCTLEYRFTAAAVGDVSQSLGVASNDPASPASLVLLGRGTVATLAVAPAVHDFGPIAVGASASAPVTLANTGNEPIGIDAVGIAPAPFGIGPGECPAPPFVLHEGMSCNLAASFAPVAKGLFEASIALTHTAQNGPTQFTLRGRGAPSAPTLSPAALDFGILSLGQASAPAAVTLTNTASVPLAVGALALAGGLDFAIVTDGCSGQTLPAAGTCQVSLRFAPVAAGAAVDLLSVPSDAIGSPKTLAMQGTGVESLIFRDGFEQQP
jgi:hypothetical protein